MQRPFTFDPPAPPHGQGAVVLRRVIGLGGGPVAVLDCDRRSPGVSSKSSSSARSVRVQIF
ncbi:hypothetical protein [Streptomyces chiangmaiensis]|uniref:Uncharacterized protein n=1 Tax=Streptomyces chiangmaiensis TaxID=766497 RepID=A0ABU7FWW7_9ACTN|nr:hypothetical protein [Streptomyces chiangmaiensis]MED7828451.1 hypothetical protein [Streptomyces chiangmaiensis]